MKRWPFYVLLVIISFAAWQYFGTQYHEVRLLISSPSQIWRYGLENRVDLLIAARTTLTEALFGLIIATLFSFVVMTLCFYKPWLMDLVLPLMVISQVVPLIVLAPFFIILLGIGIGSKIAMAAVISFFPIFVNLAHGYKSIGSNIHELLYIYNAPLTFRIRKVYFPLSTSSIMAGLKVSATLAVIGAIVAEFTGAETGLGRNLFLSAIRLEPELMMSSLFLSALVGGLLFAIILVLEKWLGRWYTK